MDKNRIVLSMWNYIEFRDYTPSMVKDWADAGFTDPMCPVFRYGKDSNEEYLRMLDLIAENGMHAMIQIDRLYTDNYGRYGEEKYRKTVREIYGIFGSHPAVSSVYVGEEPSVASTDEFINGTRVLMEENPDILPYVNLGSMERSRRVMTHDVISLEEWITDFKNGSGCDTIGYGTYSQLLPDTSGIDEHFCNINEHVSIAKKTGMDIWATMLSSAHYLYRAPQPYDFQWQLNSTVACGCRGVVWFRMYDKLIAPDYYGSPIDEFGGRAPQFYYLSLAQKRFNAHYGTIFAGLDYDKTYCMGKSFGNYFYCVGDLDEDIYSAVCTSGLISFFNGRDGHRYVTVLNTSRDEPVSVDLVYKESVKKADLIRLNGASETGNFNRDGRASNLPGDQIWLAPGGMELIRLTK